MSDAFDRMECVLDGLNRQIEALEMHLENEEIDAVALAVLTHRPYQRRNGTTVGANGSKSPTDRVVDFLQWRAERHPELAAQIIELFDSRTRAALSLRALAAWLESPEFPQSPPPGFDLPPREPVEEREARPEAAEHPPSLQALPGLTCERNVVPLRPRRPPAA
jgi:hypothetical protein